MYTEFLILATLDTLCSLFLALFCFTSRLLDTRSLTSRYSLSDFSKRTAFLLHKIHHSYTHARKRIHTLSLRR